jgi:uncharacterized protein (DUF1330 family)
MSGLNDEFLLPDDSMEPKAAPAATVKAFKEGDDGDVPELRDDIDLIAVAVEDLEVQLRDLELLGDTIKGNKGMDQTIALECESLMPGFLHDDRPIEFFTKHPSRTMYSAALEEVEEKKGGILQKIKDFIVDMYRKIVGWFKGVVKRVMEKQITTPDNVKLLGTAKTEVEQVGAALLGYEKETQEIINQAKERATVLQRQADEAAKQAEHDQDVQAAAQAKAAQTAKLLQSIDGMKAPEIFNEALLVELNAMLARLPVVTKFLGDPDIISPLMATHEDSIVNVNILLGDLQRAVSRKDYDGVEAAVTGDHFSKIVAAADAHAKAVIAFKALNPDYRVEKWGDFQRLANSPKMMAAFVYGREMLESDMHDQEKLLAGMDTLTESLYRMELYTPDKELEKTAKASLEALKNFNKQVIIPTTQRIAFSYSVIGQLLSFLRNVVSLKVNLQQTVTAKLREKVLAEAKTLGMQPADAEALFA